jgi:hypothetical protein
MKFPKTIRLPGPKSLVIGALTTQAGRPISFLVNA